MNRMTELLERINYDLPGLKKAKMCYAQGDADGAMDAVIEHFRTRTTPKYLFTAKEMEQCKRASGGETSNRGIAVRMSQNQRPAPVYHWSAAAIHPKMTMAQHVQATAAQLRRFL